MKNDKIKDFYEVKDELFSLLDDPSLSIHPVGIKQIREFVSVNELRIALETIQDHILESGSEADERIQSKLDRIESDLDRIQTGSKREFN